MIDLNAHILPVIDDGFKTNQESIKMAKKMAKLGFTDVVATPVFDVSKKMNKADEIIDAVKIFNQLLKENNIELNIYPGQIIRLNDSNNLIKDIVSGEALGINENLKYLQLDVNKIDNFEMIADIFSKLIKAGIKPILVEIEKNDLFLNNPEKFKNLVENKVLINISSGFVLAQSSKKAQKFIKYIFKNELVSLISTNATKAESGNLELKKAIQKARQISNKKFTETIKENIEKVFVGDDLELKNAE